MPGDNPNDQIPVVQNDPARQALGAQAFSPDNAAAPSSKIDRYINVTGKGLEHLPEGIGKSALDAITHPLDLSLIHI